MKPVLIRLICLLGLVITPVILSANAISPPSINAGFVNKANVNAPLGTNLTSIADWSTEYPFINYFHMARPWFSASATAFQDNNLLKVNSGGNVVALAKGQYARTVIFTGSFVDPNLSGQTFDVFYDGQGVLSYSNVNVISQSPGHDVIQLKTATNDLTTTITLLQTNPANPLRNIRLLPPGGICVNNPLVMVQNSTQCQTGKYRAFSQYYNFIVFNPNFLNDIKSYRSLRFMEWMQTNGSNQINFSQRPLPTDQFWSTNKGVPLEVMIALANLMNVDPWFNIPHLATDDYIKQFAGILKTQLAPARRAYIEYSNEVWNSGFSQTTYAYNQAISLGISNSKVDNWTGMIRFYSMQSQHVFVLFESVMGGTSRIRRVMSTQAVVPYFTQVIMDYGQAAHKTDIFAIAPYFGSIISNSTQENELLTLGVNGVFDWLFNDNNAILTYGSLPFIDRVVEAQVSALKPYGVPLTTYEGGQTFVVTGSILYDKAVNNLMDAVNRDPRMKQVYLTYLNNWRNRTGQIFHHYVHACRWSVYGRWGAKEYDAQPQANAPKYDAIMTYMAKNPLP